LGDVDGSAAASDYPAVTVDVDAAGNDAIVEDAAAEERAADDRDAARPIVPALVTPPLKAVALITIAFVLPLKTVGYGPVNAIGAPKRRYLTETQLADCAHPDCRNAAA
jgi:hypothetical protein